MKTQERYKIAGVATIVLCAAVSNSVYAADKGNAAADALSACIAIADSRDRLACFDGAAPDVLKSLEVTSDAFVARDEIFGAEDLPGRDKEEIRQKLDGIEAAVTNVSVSLSGSSSFTLANGQVWRQHYNERRMRPLDGDVEYTARIKRSLTGKYFLELTPGGARTQVTRVE